MKIVEQFKVKVASKVGFKVSILSLRDVPLVHAQTTYPKINAQATSITQVSQDFSLASGKTVAANN